MPHLICEAFRLQVVPAFLKLPESMVSLFSSVPFSSSHFSLLISEDTLEVQGNLQKEEKEVGTGYEKSSRILYGTIRPVPETVAN